MSDRIPAQRPVRELRDFQVATIESVIRSYQAGKRAILVQLPTGGGKFEIAIELVDRAARKLKQLPDGSVRLQRIGVCVPARLVNQTVRRLHSAGIYDVGVVKAGRKPRPNAQVQVISIETLRSRKQFPVFDLLLADEVHIGNRHYAPWFAMLRAAECLVIGFSATPWSEGLAELYSELVVGASMADLIRMERLSPYRVFNSPVKADLKKIKKSENEVGEQDYIATQLSKEMQRQPLIADAVGSWLVLANHQPTVTFCVDRAHADKLRTEYERAGIPCGYIDMDTPAEERDRIGEKLRTGELKVVCNVDCLTVGIDWPWISVIQLCRPTRSPMRYIQGVGRGLRFLPGKTCLVLDHSQTTVELGWPDVCYDRETSYGLNSDARKEGRKRRAKEKVARIPECPRCNFLRLPGERVCSNCGFEPKRQSTLEFVPGELTEATKDGSRKATKKFTQADKQSWWSQLLALAYERKYDGLSPQEKAQKRLKWTNAKYKSKFGVWMRGMDNVQAPPTQEVRDWVTSDNIRYSKSMKRKAA
jgi:superfamily II DNA or RNA helicase